MVSSRFLFRIRVIAVLALGFSGCVLAQGNGLAQADYLLRQGDSARALESVEHFLADRPKDARGWFLKGVILAEQKKPQEAIKVYTDLTHEYPDLAEPYNNLAVLHAAQGEYDKARAALEMAIRVKPEYAVAHENLGDIYARMAAQAYERAARLDRGNKAAPVKLKQVTELLSGSRR
jgi:tetratricopeptide (TPR) repeat protein